MAKNTFCHIEWTVTDLERAQRFYGALFDWKFEPFGPMVVFGTGTQHLGGLSLADEVQPGASPSVWIEVEDIEAQVEKAQKIGGSVVRPTHDLPGIGFSALIGDPDGNHVGLVQFTSR